MSVQKYLQKFLLYFSFFYHFLFFITSCVIFLRHRQRNSHLFSLFFSRHFFVCSWFCCLSLGLFSFLLLLLGGMCLFVCLNLFVCLFLFWNRVAKIEASSLSPHFWSSNSKIQHHDTQKFVLSPSPLSSSLAISAGVLESWDCPSGLRISK